MRAPRFLAVLVCVLPASSLHTLPGASLQRAVSRDAPGRRGALRGCASVVPPGGVGQGEKVAATATDNPFAAPMGRQKRLQLLTRELGRLPSGSTPERVQGLLNAASWETTPEQLTTLMMTVHRSNRWRAATVLANWAHNQSPPVPLTTRQYNLLISACAHARPRRALAIFRRLQASGVACDGVSYTNAIASASRTSNFELALQLFEQMEREGIAPTTISFNSAIAACARAAEWKRALVLFRQMEARSIERDTITYTNAIKACADGGELDKAQTLFAYMEVRTPPLP